MAIAKKLIKFLAKVKYEPIEHRTVYTAHDKAQTLRVSEKIVGKTLVVKMDRNFAIILIGANKILDKTKFKKVVNNRRKKLKQKPVKKIGFATETWMKKNLKGVKVGAAPPFGNLWQLPTFIDKSLFKSPKIIISAGDHNFSIKINPNLFKKLIPDLIIGNISKKRK
ncbi:YbaK/EbsC family protein [Patescibacteria group bacterium]|nr:YbaK/EbsC family protein [Patescibacteria group bacterium]